MNSNELEEIIKEALENFYRRRIDRLSKLELKDTLRKKNPYLFRAIFTTVLGFTLLFGAYMRISSAF